MADERLYLVMGSISISTRLHNIYELSLMSFICFMMMMMFILLSLTEMETHRNGKGYYNYP